MFLSDRGLFSIDLFLADARTGRSKRQVTETAVDPHLQSLQFIQSAGSWCPDGSASRSPDQPPGRPVLAFSTAIRGHEREIRLGVGGGLQPHLVPGWATHRLLRIFGGLTDLYLYDLEAGQLDG